MSMWQQAGWGATGLGPAGSQHVPCVLEAEEGVTLLAPQVKFQSLVSGTNFKKLFQASVGSQKPSPACDRRGQRPGTPCRSRWSQVASPHRRYLGCVLGICPAWPCVGTDLAEALGT